MWLSITIQKKSMATAFFTKPKIFWYFLQS